MVLPKSALLPILPFFLTAITSAQSNGKTTRYWDCCKASCGWTKKISLASGATPIKSCDKSDSPLTNFDAYSSCDSSHANGPAYMCSDQSPWAVSDTLAYGWAAATISGGNEGSWCCGCYELTFTSTALATSSKKMIVQVSNTGGDLGSNQFDLAIPGGGVGIFNGCTSEWGAPSTGWGAQYGGIASRAACDTFPAHLKAGCYFRWDWFQGADNPAMTFQKVTCPLAITNKSGCVRSGETPTGPASVSTWTSGAASPTVAPVGTAVASSLVTTATAGAPASGAGAGTVQKYAQCGGIGWTGATACVAGTTCTASGDYYSQCL